MKTATKHSTPVNSSSSDELLAECRGRVEDARRLTRAGLLESRQALQDTVAHAQGVSEHLEAHSAEHAAVLAGLTALERVLHDAQAHVERQGELREQTVQKANQISIHLRTAAGQMERASSSSRLVTVNALISAGHLGHGGAPLSVVATATGDLAREVRSLAQSLSAACGRLDGLLPKLVDLAGQINAEAVVLSGEVTEQHAALRELSEASQTELSLATDRVRDTMSEAQRTAESGCRALDFNEDFERGLDELLHLVGRLHAG